MAHGSREELWAMFALLMRPEPSPYLTKEEADEARARGETVIEIPVNRPKSSTSSPTSDE